MNSDDKKTILLVEDEVITAMLEKQQLEKKGYSIHHVTNGEDAVKTIIENLLAINLILMDIDLGSGIDGTQAAEQILNHKDIPVVFLSSHTEPDVVEKTEKITSYGYVVKNSGITVLDASIKMAFKLYEAKIREREKEAILREKDIQFRKLSANVPDLIFQFTRKPDGSYCVPIASEGIKNIFGCSPEDVVDDFTPIANVLFPEDSERVIRDIEYSAEHLTYFTCEFRVQIPGKAIQWIYSRSAPEKFPDGSITWYGFNADITERKQAEENLMKISQRLELATASVELGIWDWDVKNNIMVWDDRMLEIYGLTRDTFPGGIDAWQNGLHPDDRNRTVEECAAALRGEKKWDIAFRVLHPNGEVRYIKANGAVFFDSDRNATRMIGTNSDITERKRFEENLSDSLMKLNNIIEGTHAGTWEWDIQTGETVFNAKWAEIVGFKLDELAPISIKTWETLAHPDDLVQSNELLLKHFAGELPYHHFESRMKHKDGHWVWVLDRGQVVEWTADGKPKKMFGTHTDITERKRAEEIIKKQLDEKEIILREIHHRVKNNIANIKGLLSLQAGSTTNPEVKIALQDAISRVQSIRILYDKLLLSKDYYDISMKSYTENLIDSLLAVFNLENILIIEKHISDFNISSKKAISIGMIINELLTNAFKYAFKDRDKGIVSISIENNENNVTLIVKDNGIGIDERIEENKSPGFGLTIIKMLVEQLKGTYSIVNENGTKSVIQFEI